MFAVLAVLVGAAAQSVSGIGFNLVCAPVLIAELGAHAGVGRGLLLSAVLNVIIVARHPRAIMWRRVLPLTAAAVVATALFSRAVAGADQTLLRVVAGAALLIGVYFTWRRTIRARGPAAAVVAGVVSAGMNVVASASGPAAAIYAQAAQWDATRTRVTLQAYFLVANLVALATTGALHRTTHGLPAELIALVIGTVAGEVGAHRVRTATARALTLGIAAVSAVVLIVTALAT